MTGSSAFRLAVVLTAAVCFGMSARAQQEEGAPPPTTPQEQPAGQSQATELHIQDESKPQTVLQSLADFGAYGASFGAIKVGGGDLAPTVMRPAMQSVFRYRFGENWVGVGQFGFGWNSFKDGGDTVLTFNFGTLGAARRIVTGFRTDFRLGAGAGFYRWNYKYKGKSIRDRATNIFQKGFDPGGYLGIEAERRLTRHVTLTAFIEEHAVLSADTEKFDEHFDWNYRFTNMRLGVNYHFSPYEGILWERKGSKRLRLESGREGR